MMGMLAHLGIRKGQAFEPDERMQAIFAQAAPEALQYMIEQYHRGLMPWFYPGKKWSPLVPPGARETDWTYDFPSHYDYHARGALYYAIITSVKNYGSATFYLDLAETPDGEWLDGSKSYQPGGAARGAGARLLVDHHLRPRNRLLPARDREAAASTRRWRGLQWNEDGSIDIYFGPTAPEGKASNWLQTDPERRFFLLARFYGPNRPCSTRASS